jgi:hypothetical protein
VGRSRRLPSGARKAFILAVEFPEHRDKLRAEPLAEDFTTSISAKTRLGFTLNVLPRLAANAQRPGWRHRRDTDYLVSFARKVVRTGDAAAAIREVEANDYRPSFGSFVTISKPSKLKIDGVMKTAAGSRGRSVTNQPIMTSQTAAALVGAILGAWNFVMALLAKRPAFTVECRRMVGAETESQIRIANLEGPF